MGKGNIIAVDDSQSALQLLTGFLEAEGYDVRPCISGKMALLAAEACLPELVLLDINMPGMTGYEVCEYLKKQTATRNVPVIFISSLLETVEKVKGFKLGCVDYVTKPYQRDELLARVRTHLELHRLRHQLAQEVEARTAELRASEEKIRDSLMDTIALLAATAEMRDPHYAGHMRRVAQIASAIARELQMPQEEAHGLYLAALVHDIGKIRLPQELLAKLDSFTDDEHALVKDHASAGYDLLKTIDFPWPVADIVLQHHEHLDGSGYPQGLKDGEILPAAKILAVANAVDSLVSGRLDREGYTWEEALQEIAGKRGGHYWGRAVDACVRLCKNGWRPVV